VSADTPETLLHSALEKIVYFEARSTQLSNDLAQARAELERQKVELGRATEREIDLRRVVAELEVRATRAHGEREEAARLNDALRRERSELIAKMLDASRINGLEGIDGFDLAQFIAQLRSEVLVTRDGSLVLSPAAPLPASLPPPTDAQVKGEAPRSATTRFADELKAQGRLTVSDSEVNALTGGHAFPGRSEETLFGFSVRELAALDVAARVRAAERLTALAHPAAAPALASALHGETAPEAQVAMLTALACVAKAEAVPVVQPLLSSSSPEVRVAALKALIKLDAAQAGPHLAAATKDPDKAVRRRASLLALGLSRHDALQLGTVAIRDVDADVRALAALVLGASQTDDARPLLLEAMRDADVRVRRSASQALSSVLGRDVTGLVDLDDAHRRREVRRLASLPPVTSAERLGRRLPAAPMPTFTSTPVPPVSEAPAAVPQPAPQAVVHKPSPAPVSAPASFGTPRHAVAGLVAARTAVLEVDAAAPSSPAVPAAVLVELRAAMRGKTLSDLAEGVGASVDAVTRACGQLITTGAVVRRGLKYFVA
jgi:hypothetical protein